MGGMITFHPAIFLMHNDFIFMTLLVIKCWQYHKFITKSMLLFLSSTGSLRVIRYRLHPNMPSEDSGTWLTCMFQPVKTSIFLIFICWWSPLRQNFYVRVVQTLFWLLHNIQYVNHVFPISCNSIMIFIIVALFFIHSLLFLGLWQTTTLNSCPGTFSLTWTHL